MEYSESDFKQSFHDKSPQIANNAWKFHICEFWAKGLQLPSFQLTLTGSEVMLNHRRMIKLVKPRKEKKKQFRRFLNAYLWNLINREFRSFTWLNLQLHLTKPQIKRRSWRFYAKERENVGGKHRSKDNLWNIINKYHIFSSLISNALFTPSLLQIGIQGRYPLLGRFKLNWMYFLSLI